MPVVRGDRIGESDKLCSATPEQQDAYARLVATLPDAFGRFRLSWTMIAAAMYPRMEDARKIGRAAARWQRLVTLFETLDLVRCWEAAGLRWAELTGWVAPRNAVYHRTPEPPWGGHVHTAACLPTAIARSRATKDSTTADMLSIQLKELRVAKAERKGGEEGGPGRSGAGPDTAGRPRRGHHMASTWPSRGHACHTDQRVKCSEEGGSVHSVHSVHVVTPGIGTAAFDSPPTPSRAEPNGAEGGSAPAEENFTGRQAAQFLRRRPPGDGRQLAIVDPQDAEALRHGRVCVDALVAMTGRPAVAVLVEAGRRAWRGGEEQRFATTSLEAIRSPAWRAQVVAELSAWLDAAKLQAHPDAAWDVMPQRPEPPLPKSAVTRAMDEAVRRLEAEQEAILNADDRGGAPVLAAGAGGRPALPDR